MQQVFLVVSMGIINILSSCTKHGKDVTTDKELVGLLTMISSVAQDMTEMGFPLDLAKVSIEIKERDAMSGLFEKITDDSMQAVGPLASFGPQTLSMRQEGADGSNRLAFYDPNSKTILFQAGASQTLTKGYLAHELAHVYQDQRWGFEHIWKPYQENPSRELFNITQFIIEGYAELVRQTYEQNDATNSRKMNALSLVLGKYAETECIECFAVKSMVNLPYSLGLRFVVHQFRAGGWALVDELFYSLPTSTEQIIHPNKLDKDAPVTITLPDLIDKKSKLEKVSEGNLGEAFLLSKLLAMNMPIKEAFASASGFDGDISQVYHNEDNEELLIWRIVFDRVVDGEQLEENLRALNKPYHLMRSGRVVDWIEADREALVDKARVFLSKNPLSIEANRQDEETTREQEITMKNERGLLKNPYYN